VAPEDKAFALTIGVTRFIEKPVAMDKFVPIIEKILKQGKYTPAEPINEFDFYDGYRKRLEIKLNQKNIQIARDERLLETLSEEEKSSFQASLHQALNEREEIKHLLDEIREQLEKYSKTE
jgi:DNA-binding response OmpR family regulator